jgi:hypothetical protein
LRGAATFCRTSVVTAAANDGGELSTMDASCTATLSEGVDPHGTSLYTTISVTLMCLQTRSFRQSSNGMAKNVSRRT